MFVLIEVVDRDIGSPAYFPTMKAAHHEMCERLSDVLNCSTEDVIEAYQNGGEYDGETYIGDTFAYTTKTSGMDWAIFDVVDLPEDDCECAKIPIELFRPPTNATIVVRPNLDEHTLEFSQLMFDSVSRSFPDHSVIMLPSDFDMELMDVGALERLRAKINSIILDMVGGGI